MFPPPPLYSSRLPSIWKSQFLYQFTQWKDIATGNWQLPWHTQNRLFTWIQNNTSFLQVLKRTPWLVCRALILCLWRISTLAAWINSKVFRFRDNWTSAITLWLVTATWIGWWKCGCPKKWTTESGFYPALLHLSLVVETLQVWPVRYKCQWFEKFMTV